MKHLLVMMLAVLALSACRSQATRRPQEPVRTVVRASAPVLVDANGVEIVRVAPHIGVSTFTVEHMAKANGCRPGTAASLLTTPGPVEVYRMTCDNGAVYMAQCELRQCRPMARRPGN